MGNNSTKESRGPDPATHLGRSHSGGSPASQNAVVYGARAGRGSRPDLSFLGIGSSSTPDQPERRETKQEREARKLEKERVAREKERERSIKEEHVDGGFLVTMGVYTGTEDFSKPTVRQLMIERRIAPFWRGLNDFSENWTEHQLVAAGRGLPIPAADEIPTTLLTDSPRASNQNINSLTVPINSRSLSAASDTSGNLSPSHPAFSLPSPTSPIYPPASSHSPFRARSKTLASLTTSKNPSQTDMAPKEVQLPKDPHVNGQALEVFLYKDSIECPICFIYYPPYLNKTRCCDQLICSECFVQIKRPDPHPPEHGDSPSTTPATEEPEALVSEPACCPYCQQPEFGVTYDPPPFRRGLAYALQGQNIANFSSAMSSSSSINSAASPTLAPIERNKRRTTSLSANASTVITTDRVRPDWATKLAAARSHLARRSAAATALHSAAYLMGNNATDSRSFGFSGRSRFGRMRADSGSPASGSATPSQAGESGGRPADPLSHLRPGLREDGSSRRRSRIEDLEDMMMMEAIRLSLAAEDDRKRKSEKEALKDAKKKAKEDKKKEKKEKKIYGSGASSASGSTLSLSLPGIGRRRGNSGASHLAREITPEAMDSSDAKGKAVDRGGSSAPIDVAPRPGSSAASGGKRVDTPGLTPEQSSLPAATAPEKPSHLRQMSNASSPSSSFSESVPNSLRNEVQGSSSSLDVAGGAGRKTEDDEGTEPLFNFRSLAGMLGEEDPDDKDVARHIEHLGDEEGESSKVTPATRNGNRSRSSSHVEDLVGLDLSAGAPGALDASTSTIKSDTTLISPGMDIGNLCESEEQKRQATVLEPQLGTPEVMITPETPAAMSKEHENAKQLGAGWSHGATEIMQ
ncbi:hypothetical protein BP5796_07792 [Coleophoma crateriformis]|uniref:Protein sip5 n=1 Tax=Coleophoma crateriformis TaxID=565419 RepID=A0A3D8RCV8_9HELO|nr:hypothetical protein BP5796_07792 [Coleophoma crateriformis]